MVMNYIFGIADRRKAVGKSHFQPGPLTEICTIANLRHPESRIWIYAESESTFCFFLFFFVVVVFFWVAYDVTSSNTKFSEKLTFLTSWFKHVRSFGKFQSRSKRMANEQKSYFYWMFFFVVPSWQSKYFKLFV